MKAWNDALDSDEVLSGPFRITPGFVAFVGVLLLPAIVALSVFVGAALVANEVHAASAQTVAPAGQPSGFHVTTPDQKEVAGWKRALVGICPAH